LLDGKIFLVTGSTSGIGKEIARGLVRLGGNVIIVGRDETKTKTVARETERESPSSAKVDYFVADLTSKKSIRSLAGSVMSKYEKLDGLANNAGAFVAHRKETVDGIEYTFALNHLAPFLLTTLLLERLKASGAARIITTSSIAHRGAKIDFDDPTFERKKYSGIKAYGQSKLANILFTRELAKQLHDTEVTANCFHPGGVRTNLVRENPLLYRVVWALALPFLTSPAKGADTGIYLASSQEVERVSGKYFVKRRITVPSAAAKDDSSAARLWQLSKEMTS
jgi:retinol dehydrogenase 12